MKNFILIAASIFFFLSGYAQEFRLDTSFGEQGIVITPATHTSYIKHIAQSPDKRIIAAGANIVTVNQICAYLPNGSLDSSFGVNGIINDNSFSQNDPTSLVIQPDNKILVAYRSFVIRYLPNGEYDNSFGINGAIRIPEEDSLQHSISCIILQPNGKIIAAGSANNNFFLMRITSNGVLDNTFGIQGKTSSSFEKESFILSAIIQNDGKIVVSGGIGEYPKYDFILARYSRDGKIDSTLGNNGTITTEFHPSPFAEAAGSTIKLLPNGKLLVVGSSGFRLAMARYHPNGSLDSSFAQNGKFLSDSLKHGNDVTILPNNKFVVSANVEASPFNYAFSMLRFNENGSLDSTFGNAGELILDISAGNDYIHSLELISKGEIIVAGSARDSASVPAKFALVKYVFDGANSISDAKSQEPWAIYPNPSPSYFTLRSNQTITKHHRIELFNALGQSVLKQNISSSNASVDVRNIPEGMYFYKLFSSKDIVQQGKIEKR